MSRDVKITIGADPELFLKEKSTGKLISAHDLLPGTKLKPYPVANGAVQVDGVAAEFNIDPAQNAEMFSSNCNSVMAKLGVMLPTAHLQIMPAVIFDKEYFKTLPVNVRELGCNVDYNAWTGQPNPAPDGESTTLRTAAGHIHIGWTRVPDPMDPTHFSDCCAVVKQLDYYLGAPSLLWDSDNRRRTLYGKAGAFRPKTYGLEYRTPSNRWLISSKLMEWVWYSSFYAIHSLMNGRTRFFEKYGNYAQEIIDNNNIEEVRTGDFKKKVFATGDMQMGWPAW
jgi:hypothetical protein